MNPWRVVQKILTLDNIWLNLISEKLEDHQGNIIDYWRVEKADSVIVIVIHQDYFILPLPMYRHGIGEQTLDFAGGRITNDLTPLQMVTIILDRELQIPAHAITKITPLNHTPWVINSSFSNQKLYGFVAYLDNSSALVLNDRDYCKFSNNPQGTNQLLTELKCLQCRSLFLEYLHKNQN